MCLEFNINTDQLGKYKRLTSLYSYRYSSWLDAVYRIWLAEGAKGMFRGSIPRITWYIPASALTFMTVEFLRQNFGQKLNDNSDFKEISSLSIEKKEFQEAS